MNRDSASGGGHDASLRLFAVLGVLMMAIAALPVVCDDAADAAIIATSGSGTSTDPYSGTITGSLSYAEWPEGTVIYFLVGSVFNLEMGDVGDGDARLIKNASDFGLTVQGDCYVGTVIKAGITPIMDSHNLDYIGGSFVFMNEGDVFPDAAKGVYTTTGAQLYIPSSGSPESAWMGVDISGTTQYPANTTKDIFVYRGSPVYITDVISISGDSSGLTLNGYDLSGNLDGVEPVLVEVFGPESVYVNLIPVVEQLTVGDRFTNGELVYEIVEEGVVEVVDTNLVETSSEAMIPSTVSYGSNSYEVTSIGEDSFDGCDNLNSVIISDSVVTIGADAFLNTPLSTLVFEGDAPSFIGDGAFDTGTEIQVYTTGWNPVTALADYVGPGTSIVWANAPYPNLVFESDPARDGTVVYAGT